MHKTTLSNAIAVLAAALSVRVSFADGVRYNLTDLGRLFPGGPSFAIAVNNNGDVVGAANSHGYLYHRGTVTDLGVPFGNVSNAPGINNAGQIILNGTSLQVGVPGEHPTSFPVAPTLTSAASAGR